MERSRPARTEPEATTRSGGTHAMRLGLLNSRKGPLQVLLPGLRLLPPRAASRVVAGLGRSELLWNVPLRRRFESALARGAAHFGCDWDVPALAYELAGNLLRWRVRDLLFDGLPDGRVEPLLVAQGREHLDAARAEGRGVILLFNHFGAFLMPAHWLVRHGYPLRWLTERPRNISRLLARDFQDDGPLGQRKLFMSRKGDTEGATSVLRAVRILKQGLVVQVAGDVRWSGPHTAPARFLGRTYTFSTTWVKLAAMTGAPLVPAFGLMVPDGSYRVEFHPPFRVPAGDPKAGRSSRWLQACLDLIEDRVRHHPANSSDYFFWSESDDYLADAAA
jgi:phosphatidylinositol dimannoside acyltransferase